MVPLIITLLQWEFVVTTMVFFQCVCHNICKLHYTFPAYVIWDIYRENILH